MAEIKAFDGQFWLDGQPVLIQAGEFHYFRTPADQWRNRLELLQQSGFNAVAAYIPWLWHQLEEGQTDLDGYRHPMRSLSGFLDLAAEMGLYIIARPGPYIMAETINEGVPPWVFANYPRCAFLSQDLTVQNVASYLHPDFLACVKGWYREVFGVLAPRQVTRGGKILMVQLDNEIGMIQWVRNIIDINPDTLGRFETYLRQVYGAGVSERYPDLNAEYLQEIIVRPDAPLGRWVIEDYRRFYRSYIREYASWLWDEARANGMEVPPVINIHGFANGGKTFPIGISQLCEAMRLPGMISATDVYPLLIGEGNFHQLVMVNEMTKAVQNPEQALFSIEFQAGGNQDFGTGQSSLADLHTRLCISTGMRAINHYLFFDGENDPILSPVRRHDWGHPVRKDGSQRRDYPRYARLSRVLNSYGEDLVRAEPQQVAAIGFDLDVFMTEYNNSLTQQTTQALTHQRELILFDFIARAMSITHRPFRALELSSAALDPSRTPVVWVMLDLQCSVKIQQKLVDFLEQGGKLALIGRLPAEDFQHKPCTLLRDALGVRPAAPGIDPYLYQDLRIFDDPYVPAQFIETYTGVVDTAFAWTQDGQTVGFLQPVGAGQALVLGAALTANTLEDLAVFERMAELLGCARLFRMSDWADARINTGERGSFLFLNNYQDDPIETTVEWQGQTLFDGQRVAIPARRGLILPLDWQARDGVTICWLTAEVTGVVEDGDWLEIHTEPARFSGELVLEGFRSEPPGAGGADGRIRVQGSDGLIRLRKTV